MNWKELIGAKDFDELVATARLKLGQMGSGITNWVIGGVLRTLVELCCYGLASLYSLFVRIVPMGFLKYASGQWLDLKADELGIERRKAAAVEGFVIFARNEAMGVVKIPAKSIVKTETTASGQELRFFTDTEVLLLTGEKEVRVPVTAEFEGAPWNVGASYIRVLVTHIPGIDYVTNDDEWIVSEGVDVEDDESLRARCYLQWHELSTGSTAKAYESWAYKVDGVMDVAIVDNHPRGDGTVDVIITGANGAPSENLKEAVLAYIFTRRPLCSDVIVKGPDEKKVDLEILLALHPETGDEEKTKVAAEAILQDFFISRKDSEILPQKIGTDFIKARLNRYLMMIESVVNVKIAVPAEDVIVGSSEMAVRGTIHIETKRVESL